MGMFTYQFCEICAHGDIVSKNGVALRHELINMYICSYMKLTVYRNVKLHHCQTSNHNLYM